MRLFSSVMFCFFLILSHSSPLFSRSAKTALKTVPSASFTASVGGRAKTILERCAHSIQRVRGHEKKLKGTQRTAYVQKFNHLASFYNKSLKEFERKNQGRSISHKQAQVFLSQCTAQVNRIESFVKPKKSATQSKHSSAAHIVKRNTHPKPVHKTNTHRPKR